MAVARRSLRTCIHQVRYVGPGKAPCRDFSRSCPPPAGAPQWGSDADERDLGGYSNTRDIGSAGANRFTLQLHQLLHPMVTAIHVHPRLPCSSKEIELLPNQLPRCPVEL